MRISVLRLVMIMSLLSALNAYFLPIAGVYIGVHYIRHLLNRLCAKMPGRKTA